MDSQQWMACAIFMLVVIGCFGNALSFLLFSRPHMKCSSVNVLLCALSFIDFSLLLLSIPTFVIPNLDLWSTQQSAVTFLAYVLKLIYPMNLIMQTCSVYTMVMITCERWTAVCRPLQVRVWCTPKKSRLAVLCIFVSAALYNFARFFEYHLITTSDGALYERWLRDPINYRIYYVGYYTIMYILTHFLIPFTIMAMLNGSIIVTMWRGRQMRRTLTRQQRREQSTTVMLLIVTIVFALCNTLPFLLNVVESVFPDLFVDPRTTNIAYTLNDLSNLLVVLNSATTFLVYFAFSEKYRQTLFFIIKNGCFASISDYNNYTAMSRTASMRMNSEGDVTKAFARQMSFTSRNSDVFLKPLFLQSRGGSFSSDYNGRTSKHSGHLHHLGLSNKILKKKGYKLCKKQSRMKLPEIRVTLSNDAAINGSRECS
ncbi:7 transmembrane receptor [Dictyocaulus viviparus]|uniref:7 transmembrane receptor n=1 Tax=Dictyocaulus viviparus TaxID=29172 RepID=A0A0D8XLZ3_DICVI|nr:7 transmembrane receptor [Dictyocaulus viviparus]